MFKTMYNKIRVAINYAITTRHNRKMYKLSMSIIKHTKEQKKELCKDCKEDCTKCRMNMVAALVIEAMENV